MGSVGSLVGTVFGLADIPFAEPVVVPMTDRERLLACIAAGLNAEPEPLEPLSPVYAVRRGVARLVWHANHTGAAAGIATARTWGLDVDGMYDGDDWLWYADVHPVSAPLIADAIRAAGCYVVVWG